ncbi:unnamed protein product [Darwinula stevensoni]|uniref:RUN domain-containing protein n=1 Tax=Darwinula stevensoni TaxID=69355 RepID=A0A7R8XFS6_9CRUS|nr:unnamed protein product [Darwinula stevensoni]CAG0890963.1 unnamed protein product [Darwinula stevensoni]
MVGLVADSGKEYQEKLIKSVKKEVKQLMEEAVTRKFVNEDSGSITSLCAAVESCLSHGLRRRALGLFKSSSTTALIHKIGKTYEPASIVSSILQETEGIDPNKRSSSSSDSLNRSKPILQKKNSNSGTMGTHKYAWIRIALLEKQLAKIIDHLVSNASKYYDKDALVADPDYGPILSSLLVGPCALDFSKLKTADQFWTDPPADELVQRHRISSSCFSPGSSPQTPPSARRLGLQRFDFGYFLPGPLSIFHNLMLVIGGKYRKPLPTGSSEEIHRSLPPLAKDYVESLHQNNRVTLLYGKNNVVVQPHKSNNPEVEALAGYLSLHQTVEGLLMRWTPNQLMNGCCEEENVSPPPQDKRGSMGTIDESEEGGIDLMQKRFKRSVSIPTFPSPLVRNPSFLHASTRALECIQSAVYWDYALNLKVDDIVYLHCHQSAGEKGGTLVLVGQDGVQRPPLQFPPGGHLLAFLSCLETGLLPNGQLDPPLWSQRGKGKVFPKLRRKGRSLTDGDGKDEAMDYVFRILTNVKPSSLSADVLERTQSLLPGLGLGRVKKKPPLSPRTPTSSPRLPSSTSSTSSTKSLSLPESLSVPPSPIPEGIQQVCDTMRRQIISRAFYGWLAHCRHLRTVRTHLSGLVLPTIVSPTQPTDGSKGVTEEVWLSFHQDSQVTDADEIYRLVYFGGVEHTIRPLVWPYLLGHYPFGSTEEERGMLDEAIQAHYETTLSEWLAVEAIVRQRDKENLAATLAKLSSESTSESRSQELEAALAAQGQNMSNEVLVFDDGEVEADGASCAFRAPDDESNIKIEAEPKASDGSTRIGEENKLATLTEERDVAAEGDRNIVVTNPSVDQGPSPVHGKLS